MSDPSFVHFSPKGRERFINIMEANGYVEMPEFDTDAVRNFAKRGFGYFCGTCPLMMEDERSVTGYWCQLGWPDREFGCCNQWRPKK